MPFTPSHAVVALPFVRTPLVASAIAIGAMTPDLPLFVRGVGLNYGFTHTFANVVWTGAIAFVLFMIWRVLLRPAVAELLPRPLARRLPEEWALDAAESARRAVGGGQPKSYPLMLVLSLVLGVFSHIVWDLFTHEGRAGVRWLPALGAHWGPLQGFKWLQHGSSVIGLVVIGVWMFLWLRRRGVNGPIERLLPGGVRIGWWLSLPLTLLGAWIMGYVVFGPFTGGFTPQHLAYRVLPPACGVWGALTAALCVVIAVRRRARGVASSGQSPG